MERARGTRGGGAAAAAAASAARPRSRGAQAGSVAASTCFSSDPPRVIKSFMIQGGSGGGSVGEWPLDESGEEGRSEVEPRRLHSLAAEEGAGHRQ